MIDYIMFGLAAVLVGWYFWHCWKNGEHPFFEEVEDGDE